MKTTSFQKLFDDLPVSLIKDEPIAEDVISDDTLARVIDRTKTKCGILPVRTRRSLRRLWLIPAVAILLVVAMVTGVALSSYLFTPSYPIPLISRAPFKPLVEHYDNAVTVDASVEQDGLRLTVNKYVVDTVDKTLRLMLTVESTNGVPLTEPATAERMSMITRTTFRRVDLTCYGDGGEELVIDREHIYNLHGNGGRLMRTDGATDPYTATFQFDYKLLGGDGEEFLNKHFVLSLTDYRDEVRMMKDIGFTFENVQSLYNSMTPAAADSFTQVGVPAEYDDYYTLPDSGQRVRFSTEIDARIDNIGFLYNEIRSREQLYIAYSGISASETIPVLIDVRNGTVYACETQSRDGDRVVVRCNATSEDLAYLFMMEGVGYETVTRAKGTWAVPFTVKEATVPVYTYEVEADVAYHEYALHLTKLTLTDSSLWFDCEFTITPPPEGETTYGDVYGAIDLVLADGTVLETPFYKGPDTNIWETGKLSGTCRWGGELENFIDVSEVVAVIALGERIELK